MATAGRITSVGAVLLVVDVQGKLIGKVDRQDEVLAAIVLAIRGAQALGVPVIATEQYPQGLGPSLPEIVQLISDRYSKVSFHCAGVPEVRRRVEAGGVRSATLVGVEAHICVAQTAVELMAMGVRVQVLADAVSSRHVSDKEIALRRLERAGAVVSTVEAALFEWAESAEHPGFKTISALVKESDLIRSAAG